MAGSAVWKEAVQMSLYLNPGSEGFEEVLRTEYVDKTGLIGLTNRTIGTKQKLVCVSRPRRFGKSFAAQMLSAYYDRSCDSHALFDGLMVSQLPDYEMRINQFNVIYLDITGFISEIKKNKGSLLNVPAKINHAVKEELLAVCPELSPEKELTECLVEYVKRDGRKFYFIIDEWDAMIREARNDQDAQEAYLNLLREWFKNGNFTPFAVAGAYMTGILPIKKDGTQSAISDFEEYNMLQPGPYGKYIGFTEEEVAGLCEEKHADFSRMRQWYDGYRVRNVGSVYNPNSVMKAIRYDAFDSYWTETSAAEGLLEYICKDYSGLSRTIAELVGGIDVPVDTVGFANDLTTFRGKDDVLTLLIHLGYLSYDSENKKARIPNEEIRREFSKSIRTTEHAATQKRLLESSRLFDSTIRLDEEAVATQIEKVHMEETSPLHYNDEQSLRSVLKLAYYTYRDHYLQWEELPAGIGYADIVYFPKNNSGWPALVVELKWNRSAESAIDQIHRKQYPESIREYTGEILLVGINYDKNAKAGNRRHTCRIERLQK